ncbi:MAG: hypothetical protein KDN22_10995 [Verrucomicrobiae bacterium]|nr:hypothetical protein [Verrucomicrobiae bacterium]
MAKQLTQQQDEPHPWPKGQAASLKFNVDFAHAAEGKPQQNPDPMKQAANTNSPRTLRPALRYNPPGPGLGPSRNEGAEFLRQSGEEQEAAADIVRGMQARGMSFDQKKRALQEAFDEIHALEFEVRANTAIAELQEKQTRRKEELSKQHDLRRTSAYADIDQRALGGVSDREAARIEMERTQKWADFDKGLQREVDDLADRERAENDALHTDLARAAYTGNMPSENRNIPTMEKGGMER